MKVIKIQNELEFYNLKEVWNNLLKNSLNANIFLTWEWLFSWWKFYKKGKKLCILIIKDEEEIIGIAPLYKTKKNICGVWVEFLCLMGDQEVCSEYLNIILQTKEKALLFMIKSIEETIPWDALLFFDLPENSLLLRFIKNYSIEKKLNLITRNHTTIPYTNLPVAWDIYLNNISKNAKKNFKRRLNKLNKTFDWEFEICSNKKNFDLKKSMSQMIELHEKRWKKKGEFGVFKRKRFREFHLEVAEKFYKKGWLVISKIVINEKPAAVLLGFKYDEKLYYYQSGYDANLGEFGLGNMIILLTIKNSINEGLKEFDFLRGNDKYKYQLTNVKRKNNVVHLSKNTIKGKLAHNYFFYKPVIKFWIKKNIPNTIWKKMSDIKYKYRMKG